MAFNFEFMEHKSNTQNNAKVNGPVIKIFNLTQTKSNNASYIFMNQQAIELLNLQKDEKVKIGIDVETHKMVIVPTTSDIGRRITRNPSGSGTISVSRLIDQNEIPTQICIPTYNRNYARGGLLFSYEPKANS